MVGERTNLSICPLDLLVPNVSLPHLRCTNGVVFIPTIRQHGGEEKAEVLNAAFASVSRTETTFCPSG